MRGANRFQIWFVRLAVRGAHELEQFDDASQRDCAIHALADRYAGMKFATVFGTLIAVAPAFLNA